MLLWSLRCCQSHEGRGGLFLASAATVPVLRHTHTTPHPAATDLIADSVTVTVGATEPARKLPEPLRDCPSRSEATTSPAVFAGGTASTTRRPPLETAAVVATAGVLERPEVGGAPLPPPCSVQHGR